MSNSTKLRRDIKASGIALAEIARQAGVALTTLHTFVRKEGAEMRASNFERVTAALAGLKAEMSSSPARGMREDTASFDAGQRVAVEVIVTAEQARLLEGSGVDIKTVAHAGAEKAIKEAEARAWAEANREAIEASKAWIEKHGTFAEQLGLI
jgi:post-segregation antitoxin (ccd killing protein)